MPYSSEFRKIVLDFHIPSVQWEKAEIQYFVNFIIQLHQLEQAMIAALEDNIFNEEGNGRTEHFEELDDAHYLPNRDGLYKSIAAVRHLIHAAELIMRIGFDGDFITWLDQIQEQVTYAHKIMVLPRSKAYEEYGGA